MSLDIMNLMPKDKEELIECLSQMNNDTRFVAGGTDVLPALEGKSKGFAYIDITHVSGMNAIQMVEDKIIVGATATFSDIARDQFIKKYAHALSMAASQIGSVQIRNRATIGGNVANASPAADSLPVLTLLGAEVEILGPNGQSRMISVSDVIEDVGVSALRPCEVIWAFHIPIQRNVRSAFVKVGSRKRVTISRLNLAMSVKFSGETLSDVEVCLGTLGPRSVRITGIESKLNGISAEDFPVGPFLDLLTNAVDQAIPDRPSRTYKRTAVRGLGIDVLDVLFGSRCIW